MNLAYSMQSQDNINKVVCFTGRWKMKYDGKNIIYCLWVEWQIFPFADKINKLPKKQTNWKYVSSSHQPWIEKYVGEEDIHMPVWDLKRLYKVCKFGLKQRPAGHSNIPVSSPCVFSGCCTTSQKGSLPQKKDMCKLSDCIPIIHNRHCRRIKI